MGVRRRSACIASSGRRIKVLSLTSYSRFGKEVGTTCPCGKSHVDTAMVWERYGPTSGNEERPIDHHRGMKTYDRRVSESPRIQP